MNTSSHNYNVDLDPRLFGREASGKAGSSSAPADATGTAQAKPALQQVTKSKDAPEYRITEVAIVVPSDGLKKDQPFDIKGTIQPLAGTLTKKKVRIDLITRYKGAEDTFTTVEADIADDNTFTGSCKQLFYHDEYQRDKDKPADAKFTLEAKASGTGAEKEVISKAVDLPMATSTVILKKGKYGETWSSKNEATHPKSGKEFVPDNKVKKLQENLITFRLLPLKSDDGIFGEKTEAAVKKFQELAGKPERKQADDVKIVKTEKITFDGTIDGIVGEKTEKEIAVWLQNNWVKPDAEYRKGDYDDNGVKNKFGERGGENHHPGNGITELQKDLTTIKAYKGKIDGIFGEKTEAAVKLFQDKASKGELVEKDGKKAEIKEEEKLKGHRNGVGDGATVEAVKKEAEKGRMVEGEKGKTLEINLEIDPYLGSTLDDKYTLYSTDGKYRKTLIIKDDKIDGDDIITLKFDDIFTDLLYTLEIDSGAEGDKYNVFEDIPYDELINDGE
jgi:peptidoglycan hydrolase-like protein with peptidoglycan-binding domain